MNSYAAVLAAVVTESSPDPLLIVPYRGSKVENGKLNTK